MLGDANVQKKIDFDKAIGKKRDNVEATPSMYVNGKSVDIAKAEDSAVENAINDALGEAGLEKGPKAGTEDEAEK
jgi:hypothetical protein